jgi:DNA replicative helicase MCM subunit Mcm2 (Cdc46/Mcm family)
MLQRDEAARQVWREVYGALSEGKLGLLGSVTSRAEAQVVRLSLLYALLDCSPFIRREHLHAALAVWDYCENSARYIFGDALGYPDADRILQELRANSVGLTRTEISGLFRRNRTQEEIANALARLEERGLAMRTVRPTSGRPEELWITGGGTKETK